MIADELRRQADAFIDLVESKTQNRSANSVGTIDRARGAGASA